MTIDPAVVPGLLILAAELIALASVGFVVARVALGQSDDRVALAQGVVIGPALWGLIVNFVLYAIPGRPGAIVGWAAILVLGAVLAWRVSTPMRPPARTLAGFAVAALAIFWVALASRQFLGLPDPHIQLGQAATMQAGGAHPPELPWNPGMPAPYHYGVNLLIGLLAPPVGPDLAFITELLGAYIWMSFALVVATTLIQRGSWPTTLVLAPLLITAGAWTTIGPLPPSPIAQLPVVTGMPTGDTAAALANVYWPPGDMTWMQQTYPDVKQFSPPNIWKSFYVLAYALGFIVLERAAARRDRQWLTPVTLAVLVGFLGLVEETIAPIVLALWTALEVGRFLIDRPARSYQAARRAIAGPALAALFLVVGGGAISGILTEATAPGLSLGWIDDPGSRRPGGTFTALPGGLSLQGFGPLVIAGAAVLLAWRERLVVALVVASGAFLLAALTVHYDFAQHDVSRLDGHARNFALLALLVALSTRLRALRPRWRYSLGVLIFALITWPTAAAPSRHLSLMIGGGVQLTNAQATPRAFAPQIVGRHVLERFGSARIAAYIRDHTATDARVLSPTPMAMSIATGRPNASGFTQAAHYGSAVGPEYLDVIHRLEPSVMRRLGFAYVHATDAWRAQLPSRAARWIENPDFFEPLLRDGSQTFYRVQPAFLRLDAEPDPASFEALRRAVPASATVYLSPALPSLSSISAASVLAHARLLGDVNPARLHLRTHFGTEPLGEHIPNLVVTAAHFAPSAFQEGARAAVWANAAFAVYAPDGAVAPIMPRSPSLFSVRLSTVRVDHERIAFTATIADRATGRWGGRDWLILAADASPWAIPSVPARGPDIHKWFEAFFPPWEGITSHRYEFDARTATLALQQADGRSAPLEASAGGLGPGVWTLVMRLRQDFEEVAIIPIMKIEVSATGVTAITPYEGPLSVRPRAV